MSVWVFGVCAWLLGLNQNTPLPCSHVNSLTYDLPPPNLNLTNLNLNGSQEHPATKAMTTPKRLAPPEKSIPTILITTNCAAGSTGGQRTTIFAVPTGTSSVRRMLMGRTMHPWVLLVGSVVMRLVCVAIDAAAGTS